MKKGLIRTLSVIIFMIIIFTVWFFLSPTPGAFLIRQVFDKEARNKRDAMASAIPHTDVTIYNDLSYQQVNKDSILDIYVPNNKEGLLPVIIWTHGGAWISGDKSDTVPYFKMLADRGFVVAAVNYDLAPQAKYPNALKQINEAHQYILDNAGTYHIDTTHVILAGDSAGAQLSSQLAAMITNPDYADEAGVVPRLTPENLSAVILYCGIYDMEVLALAKEASSPIIGWGFKTATWSYLDTKDTSNAVYREASTIDHVTKDFSAVFISGGNGDGLTQSQSIPFSDTLEDLGVDVTTLFYSENHMPIHSHENQFILDKNGLDNFEQMISFIHKHVK